MSTGDKLRLVIVTPERTLFDEHASALRFPLYDGDIGILPGRLPLIGRLGCGELKITNSSGVHRFFIDGGFVQVQGSTISLLTNRAIPVESLVVADAEKQLAAADARVARTDEEIDAKQAAQQRARRMLSLQLIVIDRGTIWRFEDTAQALESTRFCHSLVSMAFDRIRLCLFGNVPDLAMFLAANRLFNLSGRGRFINDGRFSRTI